MMLTDVFLGSSNTDKDYSEKLIQIAVLLMSVGTCYRFCLVWSPKSFMWSWTLKHIKRYAFIICISTNSLKETKNTEQLKKCKCKWVSK